MTTIRCGGCGTALHYADEACPNCLPALAERPPTCAACVAKDAEINQLKQRVKELEEQARGISAAFQQMKGK